MNNDSCHVRAGRLRCSSLLSLFLFAVSICLVCTVANAQTERPLIRVSFKWSGGLYTKAVRDSNKEEFDAIEAQAINMLKARAEQDYSFIRWSTQDDSRAVAEWVVEVKSVPYPDDPIFFRYYQVYVTHYLNRTGSGTELETTNAEGNPLLSGILLYPNEREVRIGSLKIDLAQFLREQIASLMTDGVIGEQLRSFPVSQRIELVESQELGGKAISIPARLCDLQIKESAGFKVRLCLPGRDCASRSGRVGDFVLQDRAETPEEGYIIGVVQEGCREGMAGRQVTDCWNVRGVPKPPAEGWTETRSFAEKLGQSQRQEVTMFDYSPFRYSGCPSHVDEDLVGDPVDSAASPGQETP